MCFGFFKNKKDFPLLKNPYENQQQNPQNFLLTRRCIHQLHIFAITIIQFFTVTFVNIVSAKHLTNKAIG